MFVSSAQEESTLNFVTIGPVASEEMFKTVILGEPRVKRQKMNLTACTLTTSSTYEAN